MKRLLRKLPLAAVIFRHRLGRRACRVAATLGVDYGINIVVCGPPRSGTSLVFSQLCKALPGFVPMVPQKGRSREMSALDYCDRPGHLIGKQPADMLRIEAIKRRTVKKTCFVVCIRDLRDTLVSRHQWYNPENYWVHPEPAAPEQKKKRSMYGLLEYLAAIETMDRHRASNISLVLLRYEDLTTGRTTADTVLSDLELDRFKTAHDGRLVYDATEKASSAPMPNSAKWREVEHRNKIIRDFSRHPELFGYLELFGYESDRRWFDELMQDDR